jgi:hypothetical protein
MSRSYFISTLTYHDDATQIIWFWCDCCRQWRYLDGWWKGRRYITVYLWTPVKNCQPHTHNNDTTNGCEWVTKTGAPTKCQAQCKSNKQTNEHINWRLIQTIVHNFANGFQILELVFHCFSAKSLLGSMTQTYWESQRIVARLNFRLIGFNFWHCKDDKSSTHMTYM